LFDILEADSANFWQFFPFPPPSPKKGFVLLFPSTYKIVFLDGVFEFYSNFLLIRRVVVVVRVRMRREKGETEE
jgi:hypothetical protein